MPHRQSLRRLAACVLLVWLFGLTSGVVNACVVAAELRDPRLAGPASALNHHLAAPAHGGGHPDQHDHAHEHQMDHNQAPCERLCDEPAVVPQGDKQQSSPCGFWLAPAPLPTLHAWLAAESRGAIGRPGLPWTARVPIGIAFQRLAL